MRKSVHIEGPPGAGYALGIGCLFFSLAFLVAGIGAFIWALR